MNQFSNRSIQKCPLVIFGQSVERFQVLGKRSNFINELPKGLQKQHLRQVHFFDASIRCLFDDSWTFRAADWRELLVQADQAGEIDVDVRLL